MLLDHVIVVMVHGRSLRIPLNHLALHYTLVLMMLILSLVVSVLALRIVSLASSGLNPIGSCVLAR